MSSRNVLGGPLEDCSHDPLTGFFRDGCCETGPDDHGRHTVCAQMTSDFLQFSFIKGNDLITPRPSLGFPGLKPGDHWCVCAARWKEAYDAGVAPGVRLEATHAGALATIPITALLASAINPPVTAPEDDAP